MWILMIEACVAFFLLVFIVWWTMYQGKPKDRDAPKLPAQQDQQKEQHEQNPQP